MVTDIKSIIKENVNNLRNNSLFHGIPLEDLIKFLINCKHSRFQDGAVIFSEGDESSNMNIILTGEVNIFKDNALICTLQSPALIGEIGLFTETPRNATVKAAGNTLSLAITLKEINSLFQKDPKLSLKIHRNIILSMRNKINNDNQQILMLQDNLHEKDEEVLKLKKMMKAGELNKRDTGEEKAKNVVLMNEPITHNDRQNLRVSISNSNYCHVKINKRDLPVKDLSLGGLSIDLSDSKTGSVEKKWEEGMTLEGELFLKGFNSFAFSAIIRNIFPSMCGIKFERINLAMEKAIAQVINDLQRLGQVT